MGADSTLTIGKLDVDWGRNEYWRDHGGLYQPEDLRKVRYPSTTGRRRLDALERPLRTMLPRLELLGHTIDNVRTEYHAVLGPLEEYEGEYERFAPPTFEAIALVMKSLAVQRLKPIADGVALAKCLPADVKARVPERHMDWIAHRLSGTSEERFLSPEALLRLVADGPCVDLPVTWFFHQHIDWDLGNLSDFVHSLRAESRFLIVTEGTSDAKVVEKALRLRMPEVADFFYFVDMEKGYPFTGTGNLLRFCQGLASIELQNKVLVIYDNDAEGNSKFEQSNALRLPTNMRIMKLPDMPDRGPFSTIGPDGPGSATIDGRAASVETYLDLSGPGNHVVRWKNYVESVGSYQGELLTKDAVLRRFMDLRPGSLEAYDFRGVDVILSAILRECVAIASQHRARAARHAMG